jgi:hypothetical protein
LKDEGALRGAAKNSNQVVFSFISDCAGAVYNPPELSPVLTFPLLSFGAQKWWIDKSIKWVANGE